LALISRRALVLDAWPLTALVAGLFSNEPTTSRGTRERLIELCRAGAVRLDPSHIETLFRAISTAAELLTTGPVLAETFHHLERASRDDFGAVLDWTRSRFEKLRVVEVEWPDILAHTAAARFGLTDASVIALTQRLPGSALLLQDGKLHDFCVRHRVRAMSCLEIVGWRI